MKTAYTSIFLILLLFFPSCTGNNGSKDFLSNAAVDLYVQQLKLGVYKDDQLPAFTPDAIPPLLEYRNDTTMITTYPHNPISSLYLPESRLGIYVLWTIESIRAVTIKSPNLTGRFPSQNPILAVRDSVTLTLDNSLNAQQIASDAYYHWWYPNRNRKFDVYKNKDPLENSPYRWF
jgi:hypothetical protein